MIDLNSDDFDAKAAKIFNNGTAGRAACTFKGVALKTEDDNPKSPKYKVNFEDQTGAVVNISFWPLDDVNDERYAKKSVSDGKKLKALIYAICGPATKMPQANTMPELLNMTMQLLQQNTGKKVFIFTNYGSTDSPSKYLNIRAWAPFIEDGAVAENETILTWMSFELKTKPETDDVAADADASEAVDWD